MVFVFSPLKFLYLLFLPPVPKLFFFPPLKKGAVGFGEMADPTRPRLGTGDAFEIIIIFESAWKRQTELPAAASSPTAAYIVRRVFFCGSGWVFYPVRRGGFYPLWVGWVFKKKPTDPRCGELAVTSCFFVATKAWQ